MNVPMTFAQAFSKEERAAMDPEERKRLRAIYNNKHANYVEEHVNVYTRKDFRRERCWVILARCKKTGKIMGEIENSFNMGWSTERVRVIRPYLSGSFAGTERFSKAAYNKACSDYIANYDKRVNELRKRYGKTHDVFIARVGSKNCPISIDWDSFYHNRNVSKFEWRNLKFKLRT
ncbi:hypothetical protein VPFG_00372 [Vibrio phage nt-1]|uniref:Uncharacterized protein n=1 Tax=Vibrio phage nt-1 TaxID=115992 RepID=R9TFY2_9CAUD|nr:hypothetical protein VPFG_00372 [Vibrio phage nt-1]AGN30369.1 hypothetical protein VPFG_00372 [Vibrio phage nt-1]